MSQESLVTRIKLKLEKFFHWWFLLIAIILSISLIRSILRISTANEKIHQAQAKLDKLVLENEKLRKESAKVGSQDYIEKQARDRLGLAKPGETVIVLPDEEILGKLVSEPEEAEEVSLKPNWQEWLNLFL